MKRSALCFHYRPRSKAGITASRRVKLFLRRAFGIENSSTGPSECLAELLSETSLNPRPRDEQDRKDMSEAGCQTRHHVITDGAMKPILRRLCQAFQVPRIENCIERENVVAKGILARE